MAKKNSSNAYQLAIAKLESSGLGEKDLALLHMEVVESAVKCHQTFDDLPALKLNYINPFCPPKPLTGWPKWPAFYRIRYLSSPNDFSQLTKKKKPRYTNEPDAGVCAYFPTNIDWAPLLTDADQPLIITEGEFKAAKACKEGLPTIGLGGVYNYRSSKLGVTFLNELAQINWVKRNVYIVFDSDFKSNEMVCHALNSLAAELMARGALPHVASLPEVVEDGKTGLDDYLLVHSADDLAQLMHDRAQPLTLSQPLWQLNNQVIYIHNPGLVVIKETRAKLAPGAFKEHAFSTLNYAELVVKQDGTVSMKPASAAAAWLKWPLRHEAGSLTYAPGAEQLIIDESLSTRKSQWNIWPGWGVNPKKGDVSLFTQLIDHLFTGADPAAKKWFLQWCAYPLQYPGLKLFSCAVIYGIRHGTGKSLVGYTLGAIYGKNFTEIKQKDLHGNFNEWAEAKQFVLGDDVTGSNKRQDADLLKSMITQKELRVNTKFIPSYVVPDCINYLFTSNQPDSFFLEDDDRRFFVHEVQVPPLDEEFYVNYGLWLETGGAEAVFDYLLKFDVSDFNPAAPALRTSAKDRMIADVKSDLGSWVSRLVADPDRILKVGDIPVPGDLFTNRFLLQLYDPTGRTGTTANGLGRELRRAGVIQVCQGRPLKTADGYDRYYILRNHAKWSSAGAEEALSHLSSASAQKPLKY